MAIRIRRTTPTPAPEEGTQASSRKHPPLRDSTQERQICVRLDIERYAMLESMGLQHGVAPTTMARILVHRGLRAEEDAWE